MNLKKIIELEKRKNGKVWAKLECGHSRLLDGNTFSASELRCLECQEPFNIVTSSKQLIKDCIEVGLPVPTFQGRIKI